MTKLVTLHLYNHTLRIPFFKALERIHPDAAVYFDSVADRIDLALVDRVFVIPSRFLGAGEFGEITLLNSPIFWRFVIDSGQYRWIPVVAGQPHHNTPEFYEVYGPNARSE